MREEDRKFVRESIVAAWTTSVTIFNQYILEHLELCRGQIYLDNSGPFLFDYLLKFILIAIPFIKV